MEKLEKDIETTVVQSHALAKRFIGGEIMFVESVTKSCVNPKCRKKLPETDKRSVTCPHCTGDN